MTKNQLLTWILLALALIAAAGLLSTGTGCKTLGLIGATEKAIKKNLDPGDVPANASPAKKLESKIGFYLGIGAGLAVLAIVAGAIVLVWQLIHGGGWKKGMALFGGGVLAICGIYAVAVILPTLRWIVIVLLIIICVALVGALVWIGYKIFVEKRAFREVVAGFQIAKEENWDKGTKDTVAKLYAAQTEKLVAAERATLPPKPPITP